MYLSLKLCCKISINIDSSDLLFLSDLKQAKLPLDIFVEVNDIYFPFALLSFHTTSKHNQKCYISLGHLFCV